MKDDLIRVHADVVWILTFNRPKALNRQIEIWGKAGYHVNIFSNHPNIVIYPDNMLYIDEVITNNLSHKDANSYCARSWNNIFIKAFLPTLATNIGIFGAAFIQDDTNCRPDLPEIIKKKKTEYDFIWGPAGDQFFYMHIDVLKKIGWFDERYLGCYCGDADFLKRVALYYNREKISIIELHDWGFSLNDWGLSEYITRDIGNKACDGNYINQHEEMEEKFQKAGNYPLWQSQGHFKNKWGAPGNGINGIGSMMQWETPARIADIDWYPWFTAKYLKE